MTTARSGLGSWLEKPRDTGLGAGRRIRSLEHVLHAHRGSSTRRLPEFQHRELDFPGIRGTLLLFPVKCGDDVPISEANTTQMTGGAAYIKPISSPDATAITGSVSRSPATDHRWPAHHCHRCRWSTLLVTDAAGRLVRTGTPVGGNATFDLSGREQRCICDLAGFGQGRFRTFVFTE